MILRQVEVFKNGEHIANFPIKQFPNSETQCVRDVNTRSVPSSIQLEISKQLRRGYTSAQCKNGFSWKIKRN